MYNLADILRFRHKRGLEYKGSIAEKYLRMLDASKLQKPHIDFDLLKDIVNSYDIGKELDCICIHLRLGDLLSSHQRHAGYTNAVVDDIISIVTRNNLHEKYNKCKIFYGNHTGKANTEYTDNCSQKIIVTLITNLKKLNIDSVTESNSVDEDFIKIATGECFIPTIRGFSWLAASINPNDVYWDIQDPPKFDWALIQSARPTLVSGYEFHLKNKS